MIKNQKYALEQPIFPALARCVYFSVSQEFFKLVSVWCLEVFKLLTSRNNFANK